MVPSAEASPAAPPTDTGVGAPVGASRGGGELAPTQARSQDRFFACPSIRGRPDLACFGVFDGTVGDFAAHYCHVHFVENLYKQDSFLKAIDAVDSGDVEEARKALNDALPKVSEPARRRVASRDSTLLGRRRSR